MLCGIFCFFTNASNLILGFGIFLIPRFTGLDIRILDFSLIYESRISQSFIPVRPGGRDSAHPDPPPDGEESHLEEILRSAASPSIPEGNGPASAFETPAPSGPQDPGRDDPGSHDGPAGPYAPESSGHG